ncbi:MAG: hypothetical protein KDB23_15535 [Planctomycetales bacterium]|nr:hypothetical protein [Planctomycetales bacterium]
MRTIKTLIVNAIAAPFLAYNALTNDRGLVLNDTITFSTTGATIFYAVLSCFCAVMFVVALRTLRGTNAPAATVALGE